MSMLQFFLIFALKSKKAILYLSYSKHEYRIAAGTANAEIKTLFIQLC